MDDGSMREIISQEAEDAGIKREGGPSLFVHFFFTVKSKC